MEHICSRFLEADRGKKFLMHIYPTEIPEVLMFQPQVHDDGRGYFMETFRASTFEERGIEHKFVQDNQSLSKRGTLRGLHYQLRFPQGKLVRVVSGSVFDVAVDLRRSSVTFGRWVGEILSAENKKQLWIPPGFAHGFLVLSSCAELSYKCTDYFHPGDDQCLLWSDVSLAIEWPIADMAVVLSEKDQKGKLFSEAAIFE